ncbi:MAG TPA: hypothetical protein PKD54_08765, partial [Pirellulaceae bacterium]|nr:hypothetical protein [Pirellulaceae bacterium]
ASVSQLSEPNRLLTRAKTLAQQGVQALDATERNALAIEVETLLESLKDITQSSFAGAYLYGGTRTNAPPFAFAEPMVPGGTLSVQYLGSQQPSRALVGQSVMIDTFVPGQHLFGPLQRSETVLMGTSGARVGAGTDNLIGRATLQVRHTSTSYEAGSGIAPGTNSPGNDTVIGTTGKHSVRIVDTSGDGSAGTISLNGGPPVAFTNADSNLRVSNPSGQQVFVDMTSITPGFNGTIAITAQGTLSVDDGRTSTAIDFSDSQRVVDSTSGRFVHINSMDIVFTGDDYLEFPGTSNAMQALYELVQDLRGSRNLTNSEYGASLDRRIGELNDLGSQILDTVGRQSASLASLAQLDIRILDFQLDLRDRLNQVQAADISQAIFQLKTDQTLLEYTYAVTAQVTSLQLINFLR